MQLVLLLHAYFVINCDDPLIIFAMVVQVTIAQSVSFI
jgi:hypothetical protein